MPKFVFLWLVFWCGLHAASRPAPILRVLLTSGWNEKPSTEFIVLANRTFVWHSADVERRGRIEKAALEDLVAHIEAAKPGPAANDVGTLQVNWLAKSGKMAAKVFYFPGATPASGLVREIDAVSTKYGKPDRPTPSHP